MGSPFFRFGGSLETRSPIIALRHLQRVEMGLTDFCVDLVVASVPDGGVTHDRFLPRLQWILHCRWLIYRTYNFTQHGLDPSRVRRCFLRTPGTVHLLHQTFSCIRLSFCKGFGILEGFLPSPIYVSCIPMSASLPLNNAMQRIYVQKLMKLD